MYEDHWAMNHKHTCIGQKFGQGELTAFEWSTKIYHSHFLISMDIVCMAYKILWCQFVNTLCMKAWGTLCVKLGIFLIQTYQFSISRGLIYKSCDYWSFCTVVLRGQTNLHASRLSMFQMAYQAGSYTPSEWYIPPIREC